MSIHYSSPLVETTVQCYYIGYPYIEYKERGSFFLVLGSWVGNFMHAKMKNIALGMPDNVFFSVWGPNIEYEARKEVKMTKKWYFFVELPDFGPTFGALYLRILARPNFAHLTGLDKGFFLLPRPLR